VYRVAPNRVNGFPPIARPDARILILGSMPSRESLARRRYYAHPRNAFWPILVSLLHIEEESYTARARCVTECRVAIWDVLKSCERPGSLDSAIDDRTLVPNDFGRFFSEHGAIDHVFFNGAKAETVFRHHVLSGLGSRADSLVFRRLPSTSPAHASLSRERKKEAWRAILVDGVRMAA
jgi:TDG/mug DNA glycosylase family protein